MERVKIGSLLEKKQFNLERIKQILREQAICIDNGQIQLLLAKSKIVNRILGDIKAIDQELSAAGIGTLGEGAGDDFDSLAKTLLTLAEESHEAMKISESRLTYMRDEIKGELNGVIKNGQISAYKPSALRRPVYFDRRN